MNSHPMPVDDPVLTMDPVDLLSEDTITVPGQNFALVSFVSPTSRQKHEKSGMKIRGVFNTKPEAQAHVKRLMDADPTFDVYLMDMYKWCIIVPKAGDVGEQEYQDDYLNELMKGYQETQQMAKKVFDQRKENVMKDGLDKHLLPHERLPLPEDEEGAGGSGTTLDQVA